jgi:2-polyprenyl-3-methyl-5-hydroxy-6-metoxy-1,4-benzoquinol methylase
VQNKPESYEYHYTTNQPSHAHGYLLPSLLALLPKPKGQEKLRILDIGCGNGSLAHALAQQGYDVVGMEESPSGVQIAQRNFPNCQFIQGSVWQGEVILWGNTGAQLPLRK